MRIVGVDPGLVHTGVVRVTFDEANRRIERRCLVVDGPDSGAVAAWIAMLPKPDLIVAEKYNPRGGLRTNVAMTQAEADLKRDIPNLKLLDNTGIIQVVPAAVLQTLGLWQFPARTHHQDLRSAARIAVKAMMQDEKGNRLLADVIKDRIDGNAWDWSDWNE